MQNDKVNYYYQKIMESRVPYDKYRNEVGIIVEDRASGEGDILKECIQKIIDNNYEYLLTDSYLDYLGSCYEPSIDLKRILYTKYSRIDMISWYFRLIDDKYASLESGHTSNFRFTDLLDDKTKEVTFYMHNYLKLLKTKIFIHWDKIYRTVTVILSYCYIENKLDDIKNICETILEDPYKLIDDLNINNIKVGSDIWYERLINFVEEQCKKNRRVIS